MSNRFKIAAVALLAGVTLAGTLGEASAYQRDRYSHQRTGTGGYHARYWNHRGPGAGGIVAGAALGIIGGAAAGIAADRYYNGYPAYTYGPGYGATYGYDYYPDHGYYGPY